MMKRRMIGVGTLFVMAMIFSTATVDAEDGAIKIKLEPTPAAPEGASGFMILNALDNLGRFEVLIRVRGLDGNQLIAWGVGLGRRVGEFQCNRRGNGHEKKKLEEIGEFIRVKAIEHPDEDGPLIFVADIPGSE